MGYTTEFSGCFTLNKKLTEDQAEYLRMFASTRRMKRDPAKIPDIPKNERNDRCLELLKKLGLGLGQEGAYYCGPDGEGIDCAGQVRDCSILDYNDPGTQPGLWCRWIPTNDLKGICWDGREKFHSYVEWLEYIIQNFLKPWNLTLNGTVKWRGEDMDDTGTIYVDNNNVSAFRGSEDKAIVDAILNLPGKTLPKFMGIHPLLDARIGIKLKKGN